MAAEVEGPGADYKNRAEQQIEPEQKPRAVAAEVLAEARLPQAESGGHASQEQIDERGGRVRVRYPSLRNYRPRQPGMRVGVESWIHGPGKGQRDEEPNNDPQNHFLKAIRFRRSFRGAHICMLHQLN